MRLKSFRVLSALSLALFLAVSAFAGERSVRFKSGSVISAEISSSKPEIFDESAYEPYKANKVSWAELVVRLDKGRSLSVDDYVLVQNGIESKCLAIAEDEKVYSCRDSVFEKTNIFGFYRLLFPVPVQSSERPEFELRYKLLPSPLPDVPLKFRNMGSSAFTEATKIPQDGSLGLTPLEMKAMKKAATAGK